MTAARRSLTRTMLAAAAVAVLVATLRLFLRDWLAPLGVPNWAGSLLASLWVVLGVTAFLAFGRAGRSPDLGYRDAAWRFALLAAFCELLVVAGILLSGALDLDGYYTGPFAAVKERFPTAAEHALAHVPGFFVRLMLWLAIGGVVYRLARRRRHSHGAEIPVDGGSR